MTRIGGCLFVVALLVSCGSQAQKQEYTDAIRASVPSAPGQRIGGFLTMSTQTLKVQDSSIGGVTDDLKKRSGAFPTMTFAAEPHRGRAAILATPGESADFLATPTSLYARRPNTRPDERRPWVRVDLARLNDDEAPELETLLEGSGRGWASVVGPHVMLDLLAGVLPGSVKTKAKSDGAREFAFNVSVDKANRELDLSEDERDERSYMLRSIAIKGDIFPGAAVVAKDGTLRQLRITFFQTPDRVTKIGLTVSLVVSPDVQADAVALAPPVKKATIRLRTMPELSATMTQNVDAAFIAAALNAPAGLDASAIPTTTTTTTTP